MWNEEICKATQSSITFFSHLLNGIPNTGDSTTFQAINVGNPKRFSISDVVSFTHTAERGGSHVPLFLHLSLSLPPSLPPSVFTSPNSA